MILQRVSNDAEGRMGPWGQFTWQTNVSLGRKQRRTAFILQRYRSINSVGGRMKNVLATVAKTSEKF